jgi:hypothetical protein
MVPYPEMAAWAQWEDRRPLQCSVGSMLPYLQPSLDLAALVSEDPEQQAPLRA